MEIISIKTIKTFFKYVKVMFIGCALSGLKIKGIKTTSALSCRWGDKHKFQYKFSTSARLKAKDFQS